MKNRTKQIGLLAVLFVILAFVSSPVAQDMLRWEGILPDIYTGTSGTESINISIVSGQNYLETYVDVAAASYTLASTSKAGMYLVDYTDTGAVSFILDTDSLVSGRNFTVKDQGLNANTNNITISTEGSETIDEAATYAMDADGESVTLFSDGTEWHVIGAYLE